MSGNEVLEIPCLGKPFQLGMMYDCRLDCLISGEKLWTDDILSNALASRQSLQCQYEVFTGDSLEEKMEMVGARVDFKLSLMSGLTEAHNYTSFFEDRVSPKQQARLTLKCESIATYEELDVTLLESVPHEGFSEQENATHFVSGVSYGSKTFFVFDREVERNETHINVITEMTSLISSLPKICSDDTTLVKLSEIDSEESKKIKCTVYGDNPLSGRTMSFEDAVKSFVNLTTKNKTVVPIKVRLQPLSNLGVTVGKCFNQITFETISQVMNLMESFTDVNTRLNVLSNTVVFSSFSSIQKKFSKFKEMISQYKNALQKDISHLLPSVRSGDVDEKELATVLKKVDATPFTLASLSSWVDKAEKEVKLLSIYLDYFKGIQFAFDPDELDMIMNSIDYDRVVCFSFMIDTTQDAQLEKMYTFLNTGKWDQASTEERKWHENQATIRDFKDQARRFSTLAKASANNENIKFVITNNISERKDDKIAIIQMFQDGQPTDFEPDEILPQSPPVSSRVNNACFAFKSMQMHHEPQATTLFAPKIAVSEIKASESQSVAVPDERKGMQDRASIVAHRVKKWEQPKVTIKTRSNQTCDYPKIETKASSPGKFHQVAPESERGPDAKNESRSFPRHQIGEDENGSNAYEKRGKKKSAFKSNIEEHGDSSPSSVYEMSDQAGSLTLPHPNTDHTAIQALPALSARMRTTSEKISSGNSRDSVSIYKVPAIETMRDKEKKLVKKTIKDPQDGGKGSIRGVPQEKILMVMGATGAGKSTLINGMVNYILGVKWEDNFRFKLIDEAVSSQANSVTKEITAYTIHPMEGSSLPYTFTIIDTPGYGDTEGLTRDFFITSQIKEFFSLKPPFGIDHLDGIGFVTQSSLPRLTPTQTYIFDAILSIFGKDMGNSIFMMVTFADGQHPPILTAIETAKICYQRFFKFNNSALFAANTDSGFDQMFWKMGEASFQEFFCQFQSTEGVKLDQTKRVLSEREQLECLVEGLNPQIKEGLAKLDEMRHERIALHKHESEMEHNKDFEFKVPTVKAKQIDLQGTGRHTTNCLACNFTCHKDCKIADNNQKDRCVAMNDDGNCKVCTKNCFWDRHKNVPYLIEYTTVYEKRTSEDLKRKYDLAASGKTKVEGMLKQLEKVYYDLRLKVVTQMYEVRLSLHRLDEIALKPNPLTEVDYIELLIETEKREREVGFLDRVKALEEVKTKAAMFAKIKSAEEIPQLLEDILPNQEMGVSSRKISSKKSGFSHCIIQ